MALDLAKWPASRLSRALNTLTWTLERLTEDMKLAAEWGNSEELSSMIDLGITIGWDLDEIFSQTAGKPSQTALSGIQTPDSFEACLELMRAYVRAQRAKMDEHLEALGNASEDQKIQEEFLMRRLQEGGAMALRNLRSKCKRGWPGRWNEGLDEEFENFTRIQSPDA